MHLASFLLLSVFPPCFRMLVPLLMKYKQENSYSRECKYTGPPTTATTSTTPKPLEFCYPKDAKPIPTFMEPIKGFKPIITIIECGSNQYCEPDWKNFGKDLGYLELFIISYMSKS